eukprot:TRINITY_DN60682_c0_g1_i1.p1 TRINITY_DN60682_c0_g1~~TRINITY_DN60682_c0_g1_i1.p1  ORF type:complete len:367 (+),score=46.07 TRINITY_DN60682_c0_g1_i1:91-1101(+)
MSISTWSISTWLLGAVIYVLGAGLIVLGENLIKVSNTVARGAAGTWITGATTFVVGNAMHFVAFGFAAQSTLEALGATTLLWNLLWAPLFNSEQITRQHLLATVVILGGTTWSVFFGSHESTPHGLAELLPRFSRPAFMIHELFTMIAAFGCHLLYVAEHKHKMLTDFTGALSERSNGKRPGSWRSSLGPFAFAASSALVGSNAVLLSKCTSEAARVVLHGDGQEQIDRLSALMLVAAWFSFAGFWLYRLNAALKQFSALFIVPVLQSFWLCCTVVGGGVFFQEFDELSFVRIAAFTSGLVVVLVGVVLMPTHSTTVRKDSASSSLFVPFNDYQVD